MWISSGYLNTPKIILTIAILTLTACKTLGPVTSYGRGTYVVGTESGTMFEGWAEIKASSINGANDYCAKQGKLMTPIKMDTHGARVWTPIEAVLTFKCLSADDPEYKGLNNENQEVSGPRKPPVQAQPLPVNQIPTVIESKPTVTKHGWHIAAASAGS